MSILTALEQAEATIRERAAEIDRLRSALRNVLDDIRDYERTNNLAPNPPRLHCWDSVARAYTVLGSDEQKDT